MKSTWQHLELKIPPVALTAGTGALMWLADLVLPGLRLESIALRPLAVAAGLAGTCICVAGVLAFRRAQTSVDPLHPERARVLVDSGIYGRTRNPMYLGFALLLAAWAIWLANPAGAVLLVAYIAYLDRFQIQPEERALRQAFGTRFEAYRSSVRRWL